MNKTTLDFNQARAKHLQFKSRLRALLYGAPIDLLPLLSQYECEVGQWIYGEALLTYHHWPEMLELERIHADIHLCAAELIALYQTGKVEQARQGLARMEAIARTLMELLNTLERKVQGESLPDEVNNANIVQAQVDFLQNLQKANQELEERIRRQTEELQRAQQQFQLVSKATHDIFWERDLTTDQLRWNESFQTSFGYQPHETALGYELWYQCIHPDDRARVVSGLQVIMEQGGKAWSDEYRMRRSDGTYAYVLDRGYVVDNPHGRPCRMQGLLMDISHQRQAEQALRESEWTLRTLADASPAALWMTDIKGKATFVNQTWIDWTGRPLEAHLGTDWVQSILEEDRKRAIHTYLVNARHYKAYAMDFRIKHRDGQIHWCAVEGVPRYGPLGQFAGYVGSCVDITERKRAERALLDSEQYYKALFQNSSDSVYTLDASGQITYQSSNAHSLTGYTALERKGRSIFELVLAEDQPAAQAFFRQVLNAPGESVRHQLRLWHKDGSLRWIEVTLNNLIEEPTVGALVLNSRDITEQKLAEIQLTQQNEELRKINADLDGFVYRASHDLRAPLVSVLGLIGITRDEPDKSIRNTYFGLMEKSIGKLDTFIQGIIDYSRNARMEVKGQLIDFPALVEEVWDDLKYVPGSERIRKEFFIGGEGEFYSDLFRLKIIFSNMLSNAIRYANPTVDSFAGIRVRLSEQTATIEFEDNGIGIAEESLNRIFEMFYRASEKNVGSGLGLYIVQEAVQALQGNLSVTSQLGKGTVFRLELPSRSPG